MTDMFVCYELCQEIRPGMVAADDCGRCRRLQYQGIRTVLVRFEPVNGTDDSLYPYLGRTAVEDARLVFSNPVELPGLQPVGIDLVAVFLQAVVLVFCRTAGFGPGRLAPVVRFRPDFPGFLSDLGRAPVIGPLKSSSNRPGRSEAAALEAILSLLLPDSRRSR